MGWGNTLFEVASALTGGNSRAKWLHDNNPFATENGGPGNSFAPWNGEIGDDEEAPQSPLTRRDMLQRTESPLPPDDQPREIPRWLTDKSYSVIPPRGTNPSDPGPAQQFPTSKRDDADVLRLKDNLASAMANLQRLEAIDTKDKNVMSTYGGTKTYAPGTMKKRDGKMVDVGGQIKRDSMLVNIGKGLAMSLQKIAPIMLDKNVDNKTALGYAIGAAASGGVSNAIDGTLDEQDKLARDKAKAQQQVASAQGVYAANIKNRQGEANVDFTTQKAPIEFAKLTQKYEEEKGKQFGRKTSRLKTLTDAMTKGPLSIHQNGAFLDTLADLADVDEVKIADFDPRTDTIIKAETINDAETGDVYNVTYSKGGQTFTAKAIDKATGQPIKVKSDRVKSAEIQGNTSITTTGMRTKSAEVIATMNNNAKIWIANTITDVKKQGMVYDEFVRLSADPDNNDKSMDDLMTEALTNVGSIKPQP